MVKWEFLAGMDSGYHILSGTLEVYSATGSDTRAMGLAVDSLPGVLALSLGYPAYLLGVGSFLLQ